MVILFRNEVAAVGIHALREDIADLTEIGAQGRQHGLLVCLRSTTGLLRLFGGAHRLAGERSVYGLGELLLHSLHLLQTGDFRTVVLDLLLHSSIGRSVLGREQAVLVALAFHKRLRAFPRLVTLFNHFENLAHGILPPIFHEIEPLQQGVGIDLGFFLFLLNPTFGSQLVH